MRRSLVLCLIAASGSSKPVVQPALTPTSAQVKSASELSDRLGDSPETAVAVPANAPNDGIDFMNEWIYDRFGRFRRLRWGIARAVPDQSQHTVYFDITENGKNCSPPQPQ